jgi:glycosyltransferase involved in cell wall biosynthesis
MSLKLFGHVNADSDLIEAWLKHYLRLGVEQFHLVVHGSSEENERLLAIKKSYPITIEDIYQGPFCMDEKKNRLDALLARNTDQWVLVVDSDEFVEFPYEDIPATIEKLVGAGANIMAAPMLQRLTVDGALDTPTIIEDPFQTFPLCLEDLYRRLGTKAYILKFPLFFCSNGTELAEEGNHHPPLGCERRSAGLRGVTHHFKFRRTVWKRLDKMIHSDHPVRHESVQYQHYLDSHGGRLLFDDAFLYSREELFRRRLLRKLPSSEAQCPKPGGRTVAVADQRPANLERSTTAVTASEGLATATVVELGKAEPENVSVANTILFVLPKTTEFGGLENHVLDLLRHLKEPGVRLSVLCLEQDVMSSYLDDDLRAQVVVNCVGEPKSFWDWLRIIRRADPDTIVFFYNWVWAFRWQASVAALLAGVRRRFSIHDHWIVPLPPPIRRRWPRSVLRRLIGKRADHLSMRIPGYVSNRTICRSDAVREVLVNAYGFSAWKTVTVPLGVSTSRFAPSKTEGEGLRARLGIDPEDFLVICVARLGEAERVDILLEAVSSIVHQGVPCSCIIVGDGPLREKLQRQVNSLGLSENVHFAGSQRDVRPYMQAGSAFVLPSQSAGLPLSVLEAMACGLPCIVTNVGRSRDAIEDGLTGFVVPPCHPGAAADAILYLATHPDELAMMASRAREVVRKSFDLDAQIGELKREICS